MTEEAAIHIEAGIVLDGQEEEEEVGRLLIDVVIALCPLSFSLLKSRGPALREEVAQLPILFFCCV